MTAKKIDFVFSAKDNMSGVVDNLKKKLESYKTKLDKIGRTEKEYNKIISKRKSLANVGDKLEKRIPGITSLSRRKFRKTGGFDKEGKITTSNKDLGIPKIQQTEMVKFDKYKNTLKKIGSGTKRWGTTQEKLNKGLGNMRLMFRKLLMPMLGIMFFGMQIQRIFLGLLQPALKVAGVFEVLTAALQLLFLPIALVILDWVIDFFEWVSKLSEPTKKFYGKLVLLGVVIGTILFFVGQLMLGLGAIAVIFMTLLTPIVMFAGVLISAFGGIIGAMTKLLGGWGSGFAGLLIFAPLIDAFKGVGAGAKEAGEQQKSIWQKIKDWISNAISGILPWIDRMWSAFLDSGPIQLFLEKIGLTTSQLWALYNPLAAIQQKAGNMWKKFITDNPKLLEMLKDIGLDMIEIEKPVTNLNTIIPKVFDKLIEKGKEFIDALIPENLEKSWTSFVDTLTKEGGLVDVLTNLRDLFAEIWENGGRDILNFLAKMAKFAVTMLGGDEIEKREMLTSTGKGAVNAFLQDQKESDTLYYQMSTALEKALYTWWPNPEREYELFGYGTWPASQSNPLQSKNPYT